MPSSDRLRDFQEVVDQGSVTAAARVLRIPRSTLSRRLSALEQELGVRLFRRTTRKISLTPPGHALYQQARQIVAMTDRAWEAARGFDGVPRGPLRVAELLSSGVSSLEFYLDFARDFPDVQLEVLQANKKIDMVADGIDVAMWFGQVDEPSLIVKKLWSSKTMVVASPEYLASAPPLETSADLKKHKCLAWYDYRRVPVTRWPKWEGGYVEVNSQFASTDYRLVSEAAVAGLGVAFLSIGAVSKQIAAGKLKVLLADEIGRIADANLVYVEREFQPPQVRAFLDRAIVHYRRWVVEKYDFVPPELARER